jgi:starch phosphorylase
LYDPERLARILNDKTRPAQLVIAGKAHPDDTAGKRIIQGWVGFAQNPCHRRRVVFLEDYDISLAQELVQGVDVWINTPRRPWEACGTSGMKVLVNGGLNVSTLDGWWEEAYAPELGWAIGDGNHEAPAEQDLRDADELYTLLENEIIPAFYDRDPTGVARGWVARMRRSMAGLTLQYGASRMVRDYLHEAYLPAAHALQERIKDGAAAAKAMAAWERHMHKVWPDVHIGTPDFAPRDNAWTVSVPVYLGEISAAHVRVELYADAAGGCPREVLNLVHDGAIPGATGGYLYCGAVPGTRSPDNYTVRVVPSHPGVHVPTEIALIHWQK